VEVAGTDNAITNQRETVATENEAPQWFTDAVAIEPRVVTTAVRGARISMRVWGESGTDGVPDVILAHGGAANARWWDHLAPLLASDRRIVAVDFSGHGDSEHRTGYSVDVWADELVAAMDAAGLAPAPVVVGHSLGGFVAMQLAARADPLLTGIIVVDSPIAASRGGTRLEPDPVRFGNGLLHPTAEAVIARFRPVPSQPVLPFIARHVAENSVRQVDGGWTWKFDPSFFGSATDVPSTLEGLTCPVVLIVGEHGIVPDAVRHASPGYDGVAVAEIADAGHAIMLDQPLALLATIRGALAGWDSIGRRVS
jgi:pimeloyl-ACP methyl ester carboxylesterase